MEEGATEKKAPMRSRSHKVKKELRMTWNGNRVEDLRICDRERKLRR